MPAAAEVDAVVVAVAAACRELLVVVVALALRVAVSPGLPAVGAVVIFRGPRVVAAAHHGLRTGAMFHAHLGAEHRVLRSSPLAADRARVAAAYPRLPRNVHLAAIGLPSAEAPRICRRSAAAQAPEIARRNSPRAQVVRTAPAEVRPIAHPSNRHGRAAQIALEPAPPIVPHSFPPSRARELA